MLSNESRDQINNLIQINIDASKGYRDAASAVEDADLQRVFNASSREREKFADNLQRQLKNFGNEAEDSGSIKASLHRTWLTLKADVTDHNQETIVEECIFGEEAAIETYEEVMPAVGLPDVFSKMINQQYTSIKEALRQLKEWKSLFENRKVTS